MSSREDYKHKYILAIDPSGNYYEGHGTTGYCLIDYDTNIIAAGRLAAIDYDSPEEYWNAHTELIKKYSSKYEHRLMIVMEDYKLYKSKSNSQVNSKMETCRLIGLLQWFCWYVGQEYILQSASQVTTRWSDKVLYKEKIIVKQGNKILHYPSNVPLTLCHTRDAFRHALHYAMFKNRYKEPPKYSSNNYHRRQRSRY